MFVRCNQPVSTGSLTEISSSRLIAINLIAQLRCSACLRAKTRTCLYFTALHSVCQRTKCRLRKRLLDHSSPSDLPPASRCNSSSTFGKRDNLGLASSCDSLGWPNWDPLCSSIVPGAGHPPKPARPVAATTPQHSRETTTSVPPHPASAEGQWPSATRAVAGNPGGCQLSGWRLQRRRKTRHPLTKMQRRPTRGKNP
jgi:hypothetical protein